ncbi:hypothetical protein KSS87_013274, partial [Heliosperma pusillum]
QFHSLLPYFSFSFVQPVEKFYPIRQLFHSFIFCGRKLENFFLKGFNYFEYEDQSHHSMASSQ